MGPPMLASLAPASPAPASLAPASLLPPLPSLRSLRGPPPKRSRPAPIPLIIVEEHQHLLPYLHRLLKRSLLPWRFSLHHLDSHPDLSCPSFPARSAPGDMYRLLDGSQSGIAEWIVPLAFHGHVGRVTWLRQAFAGGALARGGATVLVGEAGGLMRAAVRGDEMGEPGGCQFDAARYFLDDGALVREGELGGARPLEIEVLEPGEDPAPEIEGPFVLDLIPNLELPHAPASFSPAARAKSLAVFDAHLRELFGRAGGPPAAVTVARSAEDGFCTPEAGDELQGAVVEIVGRRVRERWGRELEITLDEGVKVGATRELTPG